jgi:hypothetical protein
MLAPVIMRMTTAMTATVTIRSREDTATEAYDNQSNTKESENTTHRNVLYWNKQFYYK